MVVAVAVQQFVVGTFATAHPGLANLLAGYPLVADAAAAAAVQQLAVAAQWVAVVGRLVVAVVEPSAVAVRVAD